MIGVVLAVAALASLEPRKPFPWTLEADPVAKAAREKVSGLQIDRGPERVKTPLAVPLRRLGTLTPKDAAQLGLSNWTLGCETLDRDFADFEKYKRFIGPLGIKTIRLQAGWAKCEKEKGKYDFAWLDRIVDYANTNGLNVLLETDYGNPIYEGGGGFDLAGGFPTSDGALAAWDAWVGAMAKHFRGRVRDWAMWNEPDIGKPEKTPENIAAFNVRTAKVIRREIPDARLAGLSLARLDPAFFEKCLQALGEDVKLFEWFIYHGYTLAPESSYETVERLKAVLARYSPTARMRQGENGCPSEYSKRFALWGQPWSEYSQAKWDLRRMLGDLGHDVESSVFTVCDFNHIGRQTNTKGLLRANKSHDVIAVKRAYYAVQNTVSLFDGSLTRVKESALVEGDESLEFYEYRDGANRPFYVFWQSASELTLQDQDRGLLMKDWHPFKHSYVRPGDSFETRPAALTLAKAAALKDPVWIDLLSGKVYEFPKKDVLAHADGVTYVNVPVYDSPCVLAERRVIDLTESRCRATRLFLPEVVYAAPGVELNVYWANVLDTVKPQLYCFDTTCAVGRNQEERFTWTPTAKDAGREIPLTVTAVKEGEIVDVATTVIRVAKTDVDRTKPVALATLAASLTGSRYPDYILEGLKADGYTGFREVGSHAGGGAPVKAGGPAHDGYGGFTFGDFLMRFLMSESELPLLQDEAERDQLKALGLVTGRKKSFGMRSPLLRIQDGKKVVDVQMWLDKVNGGKPPEVIFIELGCNQTFAATDDAELHEIIRDVQIPNARILLHHLREACPNALIGFGMETLGSGQDGYAASYGCHFSEANWRRNMFVLNRAIVDFVKESGDPRVMVVPFGHAISRDFSYLREEKPAHAYSEKKLSRDRNALHCGAAGGHQLADTVRCWIENVWEDL